jgi:hypothetical protein
MKKIQQYIRATHAALISIVSGKFKRLEDRRNLKLLRQYDWYYQHSWFSKQFFQKLKRKTMNIIYKLYSSIEEHLLEKYLVEFHFYTGVMDKEKLDEYNKKHGTMYLGEFKCYLPILFMVKNYDELEHLTSIINNQLTTQYRCSIFQINTSEKILTEEMLNLKIQITKDKMLNSDTGVLNISTFNLTPTEKNLEIKYKNKEDRYKFQILKSGHELLRQRLEYVVQFHKNNLEE